MGTAHDAPPPERRAEMAAREVGFQTELCTFLQERIALVAAFLGLSGALLLVVSRAADITNHGWVPENWLHPSVVTHTIVVLLAIPVYAVLKGRTLPAKALWWLDAAIAETVIASCLLVYAFSYRTGIRQVVPILGLLLIARSVVIPSRALRTLLLSLPAPVGVLVIQLVHGRVYTLDGQAWPQQGFVAYVLWDQATLVIAVSLATATSYVLYELRVRAFEIARIGRYTLEERIGGGAVGQVFRARHAHIRRSVAVKILRPEIAGERNLALFEKEVQRTSELTHPNTVSIFDYGLTADGLFYYAMEFLEGADLDRILRVGGPMPPGRAVHVLRQACGALSEAHDRGLIHCDLKLENLMLCHQGGRLDVLKVLDFGLAKNVARSARGEGDGKAYGTPLTMAPEVIRGRAIGPSTDLYSLGAVAYCLVAGCPPYEGESVGAVLAQHLRATPEPPSGRHSGVPEDLEVLILACLSKDPAARPQSAVALEDALAACEAAGTWTLTDAEAWWRAHREAIRKLEVEADRDASSRSVSTVGVSTLV